MSYLFGSAILGIFFFVSGMWLLRQWKLARNGVVGKARVVRKRSPFGGIKGPVSRVIEYDLLTPRGEFARNSAFVGEAVSLVHQEGSEIEIVYLKNNPSVNGTKYMVNRAREFLNMAPL